MGFGLRPGRIGLLALVLGLLGWAIPRLWAAPTAIIEEWSGRYFSKTEGAFYLVLKLHNFKGERDRSAMSTNVQVEIYNILKRQKLILSYPVFARGDGADEFPIWLMQAGKYHIRRVQLVDGQGQKRSFTFKKPKSFIVKRQTISNLGFWLIAPKGKDQLQARIKMIGNRFDPSTVQGETVSEVIDGYSGLVQKKFRGQRAKIEAERDHSTDHEVRATYRFRRNIAMYYGLNLFNNNHQARAIVNVLDTFDPNMRNCYTNRLDVDANLRGTIVFTFLLSQITGTMRRIKHAGGSIRDAELVRCLALELGQINFPVSVNMIGKLVYSFNYENVR